jgi:hypothetical protein
MLNVGRSHTVHPKIAAIPLTLARIQDIKCKYIKKQVAHMMLNMAFLPMVELPAGA